MKRAFALACVVFAILLPSLGAWGATIGTNVSGPATGDAASIYWNPAAMTLLRETEIMVYGGVSLVRAHYKRDYLNPNTGRAYPQADEIAPTPDLFLGAVTSATLERFRFGLGLTAPLIDGAMWPATEEGEPSPARYYGLDSHVAFLTISPAVAYKINRYVSVGLGCDVVIALLRNRNIIDFGAKVNQMTCQMQGTAPEQCPLDAPLAREDPTWDAPLNADGMGISAGVFGGILITPVPWLRIGASFHSGAGKVDIPTKVSAEIPTVVADFISQNLPMVELPPLDVDATVKVTYPMRFTAGVVVSPTERLDLALDFQWVDKSRMSTISTIVYRKPTSPALFTDKVTYNPFFDLFCVRLTGAFRVLPALGASLSLAFEPNTRPERTASPTTVDMHKFVLRLGVAWQVSRRVTLAAEYGRYFIVTREIKENIFAPNASPTTPEEEAMDRPPGTGTYSAESDKFALGVIVRF